MLGRHGQHLGEYAVLIGIVASAFVATQMYMTRRIAGGLIATSQIVLGPPDVQEASSGSSSTTTVRETGAGGQVTTVITSSGSGSSSAGHVLAEAYGPYIGEYLTVNEDTSVHLSNLSRYDVERDGVIDDQDLEKLFDDPEDFNRDGHEDVADLQTVAFNYGEAAPPKLTLKKKSQFKDYVSEDGLVHMAPGLTRTFDARTDLRDEAKGPLIGLGALVDAELEQLGGEEDGVEPILLKISGEGEADLLNYLLEGGTLDISVLDSLTLADQDTAGDTGASAELKALLDELEILLSPDQVMVSATPIDELDLGAVQNATREDHDQWPDRLDAQEQEAETTIRAEMSEETEDQIAFIYQENVITALGLNRDAIEGRPLSEESTWDAFADWVFNPDNTQTKDLVSDEGLQKAGVELSAEEFEAAFRELGKSDDPDTNKKENAAWVAFSQRNRVNLYANFGGLLGDPPPIPVQSVELRDDQGNVVVTIKGNGSSLGEFMANMFRGEVDDAFDMTLGDQYKGGQLIVKKVGTGEKHGTLFDVAERKAQIPLGIDMNKDGDLNDDGDVRFVSFAHDPLAGEIGVDGFIRNGEGGAVNVLVPRVTTEGAFETATIGLDDQGELKQGQVWNPDTESINEDVQIFVPVAGKEGDQPSGWVVFESTQQGGITSAAGLKPVGLLRDSDHDGKIGEADFKAAADTPLVFVTGDTPLGWQPTDVVMTDVPTVEELLASHRTSAGDAVLYKRYNAETVAPEDRAQVPSGLTREAVIDLVAQGGGSVPATPARAAWAAKFVDASYTVVEDPEGVNAFAPGEAPPLKAPSLSNRVGGVTLDVTINVLDVVGDTNVETPPTAGAGGRVTP